MKQVFEGDLDIERLVLSISAETGVSIEAENTLIIFDEVQEVPKALTSLKYFYENAPQYAIVAAESLLGVALHQGTSFPVGKVDFLDLYPLNFREFLCAMGEKQFVSMLDSCDTQMVTVFKTKYIERLREYYFVGGMPEVVKDFSEKKDYNRVRAIQKNLINYYQQDFSKHAEIKLVPRLNLVWNSIPMQLAKENKKYIDERVHELLKLISLDGLEKRYPSQLSGGQRQRVAFARALAPNPHLLLLDEPFAAIDAKVRQELRSWLKEMIEKLGITSIFVTHDQDEIIITNKGHIEQKGTPLEIYQNPQTAFAATFFGQTSQITNYQSFHSFPKVDNVDKAIIRPEFVKVSKKNEVQRFGPSASEGVVERVSFRGDSLELLVNVNDNQIIAKRGLEEKSIAVGEKVDVFIYRLFVTVGEKAMLLENQSLVDDSVFI